MAHETVFQLVEERLGPQATAVLASYLKRHYHFWKFQRKSDEETLSVARHILCDAGFAKLCRDLAGSSIVARASSSQSSVPRWGRATDSISSARSDSPERRNHTRICTLWLV